MLNAVYPCVYREHKAAEEIKIISSGLSLCIQGTPHPMFPNPVTKRFIPVYTGNTFYHPDSIHQISVYPCVYREHINCCMIGRFGTGLSLCIQGTHATFNTMEGDLRFIPVYTGNTSVTTISMSSFSVYPCVYREHSNYNILFYN